MLILPKWYDLHTHLRQDALLEVTIKHHLQAQCAGVLAMPNTKPPVAKVVASDPLPYDSIESYRSQIMDAGGGAFDQVIVPLYLTQDTTPAMIEAGVKHGVLRACKYYPPAGTTNSDLAASIDHYISSDVLQAMADHGVVLCIHGEEHSLHGAQYFDRTHNAESLFYKKWMPYLYEKFDQLKMVCEHITTKQAVEFVKQTDTRVAATITPQHLIYTIGDLLNRLNYHLFCYPVLKFSEDREALRKAAIDPNNIKFFAGTDSAPHTDKALSCGCAAGCYTAPIAPQLYAHAFELAGANLDQQYWQSIFRKFLCENGPNFYQLPASKEVFAMTRQQSIVDTFDVGSRSIKTLPYGDDLTQTTLQWAIDPAALDQ